VLVLNAVERSDGDLNVPLIHGKDVCSWLSLAFTTATCARDSCSQLNLTLLQRRIVLTATLDFILKNPISAILATKAQCGEYWTLLVPVQVEKDLETGSQNRLRLYQHS
jgi:hypothetical protein